MYKKERQDINIDWRLKKEPTFFFIKQNSFLSLIVERKTKKEHFLRSHLGESVVSRKMH